MITLPAHMRSEEPLEALRQQDMIPAVYYGAGTETTSIAVKAPAFLKVFREAGETTAVTLDFGDRKVSTLIHEVQFNPLTEHPLHIDFLVIDMKKEIEVAVPIEFTGISEAEKGGLGTVVKVLHEVKVRALPSDLPHSILVDLEPLKTLEDQIHIKDITAPQGVTIITPEEEIVVLVRPFVEEKEETPMDLSQIEVVEKGKKEEAEEEKPAE